MRTSQCGSKCHEYRDNDRKNIRIADDKVKYDAACKRLLSTRTSPVEKCQILEGDFHIEMTQTLESEVSLMCNLSKGVEEKGIEKGKIYGAISMCQDLDLPEDVIIEKLQNKFHLSEEKAKEYLHNFAE